MNQKQSSLERFFGKGKWEYDETAEGSQAACKKKTAIQRKYQNSYLCYEFITIGDSQAPYPLCVIHDRQKQWLKATTSTNVSGLKASFLVADKIEAQSLEIKMSQHGTRFRWMNP